MREDGLEELCQEHIGKVYGRKLAQTELNSKLTLSGMLPKVIKSNYGWIRGWLMDNLEINILKFLPLLDNKIF